MQLLSYQISALLYGSIGKVVRTIGGIHLLVKRNIVIVRLSSQAFIYTAHDECGNKHDMTSVSQLKK